MKLDIGTNYSPTVQQAFRDWNENRAYLDNGGNYRLRPEAATPTHRPKGRKIAPWNREVKRLFSDSGEFHRAAKEFRRLEPHRFEAYYSLAEICRHCDGGQFTSCHATEQETGLR
jgi:hypothetical protein